MGERFDERRYVQEVLEPAREADNTPPADLRVRYALREPLRPAEVTETVRLVRQCWRRHRGMLKFKRLINRLEADHARLAPVFAAAADDDLGPLRKALREAGRQADARLADARRRLDDAAGRLRLMAPEVLSSVVASTGVGRAEAERLVAELSIEVREPDELPAVSPYPGYGRARDALDTLGARHLAHFAYGDRCAGMRVLDRFRVPGGEPLAHALDGTAAEWARRPRGPSTTSADTVLAALRAAPDPAALIRYDIVTRLRERAPEHPYDDTLLRHAVEDLDLAPSDARRLIFALRMERGVAGGGVTARLRDLLDAGEIQAAVAFADALDANALTGDAASLIAEARARLTTAERLRDLALSAEDPDQAWLALEDALRQVPDLPGAHDILSRLAPKPIQDLRVEILAPAPPSPHRPTEATPSHATSPHNDPRHQPKRDPNTPPRHTDPHPHQPTDHSPPHTELVLSGDGFEDPQTRGSGQRVRLDREVVVVSWRPGSKAGEIVYSVTRNGEPLATTTRTRVWDEDPPVNSPLVYRVTARRGEAAAVAVAAEPVMVRPEPRDIRLLAGDGVVTGRWSLPEGASRIVVRRDGMPVECGVAGFQDRSVTNGTGYTYLVSAAYPDLGGETITPGVRWHVTPRARPTAVLDFSLEPDPSMAGRFLIRCADPAEGLLEIMAMSAPPPWRPGTTLPVAEVRRMGRSLPVTLTDAGYAVRPGAGESLLLAITVAGDLATVGACREHVYLAAPTRLTAARRGPVVYVGFEWPPNAPEVEIRWNEAEMLVTRAAYQAQGGVRLDVPESRAVTIEAAATAVVHGRRLRGAPTRVELPEQLTVRYYLMRQGAPWRRGLAIDLAGDRPLRLPYLCLVLKPGSHQPSSPADGQVIAEWVDVDVPTRLTLPAPRHTRPYWLRCFAEGDSELIDPPVRQLKAE
ncbi:hypothetical protein AB0K60_10620 [Thermopolyspora sp. NPDC052614]|uniref:hypothetical protein n=1 Tax=Thermopolyspora sp. NPDC052614 TaxID=3155682 RepID=UPI0034391FF5